MGNTQRLLHTSETYGFLDVIIPEFSHVTVVNGNTIVVPEKLHILPFDDICSETVRECIPTKSAKLIQKICDRKLGACAIIRNGRLYYFHFKDLPEVVWTVNLGKSDPEFVRGNVWFIWFSLDNEIYGKLQKYRT